MTTAKPRSTTGSKLANSVRRAKTQPTEQDASEVKSATKPATAQSTVPVSKQTERAIEESEIITSMPSNRVWPD